MTAPSLNPEQAPSGPLDAAVSASTPEREAREGRDAQAGSQGPSGVSGVAPLRGELAPWALLAAHPPVRPPETETVRGGRRLTLAAMELINDTRTEGDPA